MAANVLGTPITEETLKSLPSFHDKTITQLDRARVAMEMKNAEGKGVNARKMVEYLNDERFKDSVATMGLIYNATGNNITFLREHEWEGHLCESPYPLIIQNGQWGVFVHGKYWNSTNCSKGAVVYQARNSNGGLFHGCFAWANNRALTGDNNRVIAQVGNTASFTTDQAMDNVRTQLDAGGGKRLTSMATNQNFGQIIVAIGDDRITVVEAIFTLPGVF